MISSTRADYPGFAPPDDGGGAPGADGGPAGVIVLSLALPPALCPLKVRVGANSPSL